MPAINAGIALRFFRLTALVAVAAIVNATMSELMNPAQIQPEEFFALPRLFARDSTNSATLTWTAPAEDGTVGGPSSSYDIRYANDALNESNWSSATLLVSPPPPATPGTIETTIVEGLLPRTTYAFGIKTFDEANNVSALSNIATHTTSCIESWLCAEWSACDAGTQVRTCDDLNDCGTTLERPLETQTCSCVENWTCTDWSSCLRGRQTRSCTDTAACGTTYDLPEESQACASGGQPRVPSVVVGLNAGNEPRVRVFNSEGRRLASFRAYERSFRGGVSVAVGDIDGNGIDEIITGPGPGRAPTIRVFTKSGRLLKSFNVFSSSFQGGVNVAVGDFQKDGSVDVVVAPKSIFTSRVRVFSLVGGVFQRSFREFTAFPGSFKGETNVAAADVDGNGTDELLTVPGTGGGPHVRLFEVVNGQFETRTLGFLAYSRKFRGGVSFATGDIDGDGNDEIVTAPVMRGGPHVRTFGWNSNGTFILQSPGFFAFTERFRGGTSITTMDNDGDGDSEIVVAVRSGDQALVRIWRADGKQLLREWLAFPQEIQTGVSLAVGYLTRE